MSYGVGRRRGSDPLLLGLWCRSAAAALIRLLAWEPKKDKKKKVLPLGRDKRLDRLRVSIRSLEAGAGRGRGMQAHHWVTPCTVGGSEPTTDCPCRSVPRPLVMGLPLQRFDLLPSRGSCLGLGARHELESCCFLAGGLWARCFGSELPSPPCTMRITQRD